MEQSKQTKLASRQDEFMWVCVVLEQCSIWHENDLQHCQFGMCFGIRTIIYCEWRFVWWLRSHVICGTQQYPWYVSMCCVFIYNFNLDLRPTDNNDTNKIHLSLIECTTRKTEQWNLSADGVFRPLCVFVKTEECWTLSTNINEELLPYIWNRVKILCNKTDGRYCWAHFRLLITGHK